MFQSLLLRPSSQWELRSQCPNMWALVRFMGDCAGTRPGTRSINTEGVGFSMLMTRRIACFYYPSRGDFPHR
jgi:hypothetical protein